MPGLSDYLTQRETNRNRSGVTVYSPTRPLRRPGSTADAGTASRVANRNRPVEVNARINNETGARGPTLDDLLAIKPQVDRQRSQAESAAWEAGRWPGPLETLRRPVANVVSNPVFRAVMAPLNLLDYPRRAVASSVQELADAFNGGDASWSDWIDQVNDPSFGGGKILGADFAEQPWYLRMPARFAFGGATTVGLDVAGQDEWANRFTGLGFDIASDPLTYLAGSSALTGAGRAERLSLVARLSEGGAQDLVEKVAKYGVSALTDEERIRVSQLVNKAGESLGEPLRASGFRFTVPLSDVESRPFLGRVERGMAMGRARLRNTANTWMGRIFADIRAPSGMEEVYQSLVRGRGRLSRTEAAERLVAYNASKEGIGEAVGKGAAELAHVMSQAKNKEEVDAWLRQAQVATGGTGPVAEFFQGFKSYLDKVGFDTSQFSDSYVHRVLSGWARDFMKTGDARAKSFAQFFGYNVDELARDAPPLHARVAFLPGTHEIHGQTIVITADDGLHEINAKLAKAFPDLPGDFYETDFPRIATSYVKSVAESVGSIKARQRLMQSKANLLRAADDPDVHDMVTNIEATMDLNKVAKEKMTALMQVASGSARRMRSELAQRRKGISGVVLDQIRSSLNEVTSLKNARRVEINKLLDNLHTLENAPQGLVDVFHAELANIDTHFDAVLEQLTQISKRAANDLRRWRDGGGVGPLPPLMGKVAELRQAAASAASQRLLMESLLDQATIHQQLADRFDHWVDDVGLLERLAAQDLNLSSDLAQGEGRRWVDGLGRERTGPLSHEVTSTIPDPGLATTLVRQDVARINTLEELDQAMAGLPRDVVARITGEARALSGPIHSAATAAAQSERHLAAAEAMHGARVAEAHTEYARAAASVHMASDHAYSLEGRVGIGDARVQALDRLDQAKQVHGSAQRELERAQAPIVMARQHRDAMVAELENLQNKQLSVISDGIESARAGLDPSVLNDTARVNVDPGGVPTAPDAAGIFPATETAPRAQPGAHPDPYEPAPAPHQTVDEQLQIAQERASKHRQQAAFFNSENHDVELARQRVALVARDERAEAVMVETGGRSKTFTADLGGPIRLKTGHPRASAIEARRDELRVGLEGTHDTLTSSRQRLLSAHNDIIDHGSSVERRAELNAAKKNLNRAEREHARQLKEVYETELAMIEFEANPALRNRWRKLVRERYELALEDGNLAHRLDRIGPYGERQRTLAQAAEREVADLKMSQLDRSVEQYQPRRFGGRARNAEDISRETLLSDHKLRQRQLQRIRGEIAYMDELAGRQGIPPERLAVFQVRRTQLERAARSLEAGQAASLEAASQVSINRIRRINADQLAAVRSGRLPEDSRQVIQHLSTAYSTDDRALLTEAYRTLRESPTHDPVAYSRVQSANLRQIETRINELVSQRGGGGLDVTQLQMINEELTALRSQRRQLNSAIAGARVTGPSQREAAKATIARIEAKANSVRVGLREGMTAEAADLRTKLARIAEIRRGLTPEQETALNAIDLKLGTLPSRTLHGQARDVLTLGREMQTDHIPRLVEHGAIDQATADRTLARIDSLHQLLFGYESKASPYAGKRIRQETSDLMRDLDVMAAYGLVIEAGIKPTPMVGAYVLRARLTKELAELDEQINVRIAAKSAKVTELSDAVNQAIAGHRVAMAEAEYDVERLTALRGKPGQNEAALKAARNKRDYRKAKIAQLEATGEMSFVQASELDDLVDQMARVYFDLFEPLRTEQNTWSRARDGIAAGRGGYIDMAHRSRMGVEYLRPEAEVYQAAIERLQIAIQEAEAAGSDTVHWLDATSQELLDPLTGKSPTTERMAKALGLDDIPGEGARRRAGEEEARRIDVIRRGEDPAKRRERLISSGGRPEGLKPRRRVRQQQERAAAERAAMPSRPGALEIPPHARGELEYRTRGNLAAGRTRTPLTYQVAHRDETVLPLAEARKLLEQRARPNNINSPTQRLARQELRLSVFDGSAQRRVDQIDTLIEDLQRPPNIAELVKENSDLQTKAARHNGGVLTEEQQVRFDANVVRIEQAKQHSANQITPEQVNELVAEREQLMVNIDKVMTEEKLDQFDYETAINALTAPEAFLRDVFAGRIELNAATRERLKEMTSPEMGELGIQMRSVLDQAEREGWTDDEFREVFASLYGTRYNTETGRIGSGTLAEEDANLLAGPNDEAIGVPVRGQGDAAARSRQTILVDFIHSRESSFRDNEREIKGMLKLLGIDLMPGERDQSKAFDQLRRLIGKESGGEPDLSKLKSVLLERMVEMGYDPTRTGEAILREMTARKARLQAWANSLGALFPVDEASMITDPVVFFTQLENRLRTVAAGRDADNLIDQLVRFTDIAPPENVQRISQAYISELTSKLEAARAVGDETAVAELEQRLGQAQAGIAPPISVPPPPVELSREQWAVRRQSLDAEAADLAKTRQSLTEERDAVASQMTDGGPRRPTNAGEEADFWQARMNDATEANDSEAALNAMVRMQEADAIASHNPGGPLSASEDVITAAMPTEDLSLQPRLNELNDNLNNLAVHEQANADAVAKLGDEPEPNLFADASAPAPPPERMTPAPDGPLADETLNQAEMTAQLQHIMEQLNDMIDLHGSFEASPPPIQQAMGELATRGQYLNERLNALARVDQLRKQSEVFRNWWEVSNVRRTETGTAAAIPGQVDIDWQSSLREGVPVTMPIRQLLADGHKMPVNFGTRVGMGEGMGKELRRISEGAAGRQRREGLTLVDTLDALFSEGSVLPKRRPPGVRLAREEEKLTGRLGQVEEGAAAVEARAGELGAKAREGAARHREEAARLQAEAEALRPGVQASEERQAALIAETARDPAAMRVQANIAGRYNEARFAAGARYTAALNENDMQIGKVRSEIAKLQQGVMSSTTRENWLKITLHQAEQAAKANDPTARQYIDDMRQLANARRSLRPADTTYQAEYDAVESLLTSYYADASKIKMTQEYADNIEARLKQFKQASKADKVGSASLVDPVIKRAIRDGWEPLSELLLEKDQSDRVIASTLAEGFTNFNKGLKDGVIWDLVDRYTAFFKAYAVARPGFHVRNAMSGVFMNTVAGVPVAPQLEAISIWKAFRANPREFWTQTTDRVRNALTAMMSTGGGGQFAEGYDLTNQSISKGSRAYSFLMNNRLMRWNRRMGERVEGVMRLGMALDTVDRGGTISTAMQRVAKYHFDYREISRLDHAAKRLIPFWTFMSRNLPLQIEQMWSRPRAYLWYQSVVRNFSETANPFTPDYWLGQGAFTMDPNAATATGSEAPWYLAPDLPHLRIAEPLVAASQGDWPKVGFSDVNPLFLAPLEAFEMGRKAYTGAPIEGYEKLSPPMAAFYPLFRALGMTETGGTSGDTLVDERGAHVVRSTIPPIDMLERLIPGWGDPESLSSDRELETLARFFGIPVYQLTQRLRNSTARRRVSDQRSDVRREAQIASM